MKAIADNVLAGARGTEIFADTTDNTGVSFSAILVLADAVFDNLEEANQIGSEAATDEHDVKPAGEQGVAAFTIPAGAFLTPKADIFSRIQLTSGIVQGVRH